MEGILKIKSLHDFIVVLVTIKMLLIIFSKILQKITLFFTSSLEFLNSWDPKRNLTQLPNMAYSMALAQFYNSKNQDYALADHSIQRALIEFPGVLLPLLDKCSVDIDKRVLGSQFFLDAQSK